MEPPFTSSSSSRAPGTVVKQPGPLILNRTACSTADRSGPRLSSRSLHQDGCLTSLNYFSKQLFFSLICAFAVAIASPAATRAVDGCSSAGFKLATSINLGATPFGMAVGDFNGDGRLDLVAALNNGSSELTLLLGRGGTNGFGPPAYIPAGGQPGNITVGDLNGDGKPDLAVTVGGFGQPGRLSILLNDGTGTFGAPNLITLAGGPSRAVLGDLNNDGKLDIVTALSTGTSD